MIRAWAGGLCLAGLVAAAAAAPPESAPPATLPDAPVAEIFDPDASRAGFEVDLRMLGRVRGRFRQIEGELQPDDGRWRVRVRLDARELDLDGPEWMVRATRSDKFLAVDRHPDIRFVSAPFPRDLLRRGGELEGELRLRGRVRPVRFQVEPADCARPGRTCDIRVIGRVSRRDFGMSAQRLWVRDEVGFDFRVRLRDPVRP
jgi:polyisoprenoid-binding protein YceI